MAKKKTTKKANAEEVPRGKRSPEVVEIEKDLGTYISLETLADSEGGKILVDNLAKDIIGLTESLGIKYKTATHAELMGLCADLESKTTILRLITRAKKNKELAQDALKEALMEDEKDE